MIGPSQQDLVQKPAEFARSVVSVRLLVRMGVLHFDHKALTLVANVIGEVF
jgi:hypothetical protein